MIQKDLSALIRTPDAQAWLVDALTEAWWAEHEDDSRDKAFDTDYRFSSAGMCTRMLKFRDDETLEPDNAPDLPALWRMRLGSIVHEWLDALNPDGYEIEHEVAVELTDGDFTSSGHIDAVLTDKHQQRTVLEFKTVNDFGFKSSAFGVRGPAEGPKPAHIAQLAMAAQAVGAQYGVILYLTMQPISPSMARKYEVNSGGRIAAQWTYSSDELREVYEMERDRCLNSEGRALVLGDRTVIEITDPDHGTYKSEQGEIGTTWQCGYCDYKGHCSATWG